MAYELPAAALRIFQRCVRCVAKLGKDAALTLQPHGLALRGADDAQSAALSFVFGECFIGSSDALEEITVVVVAKQLLVALNVKSEKLTIRLANQRLFLEFSNAHSKVRHGVPLLETLPFLPQLPAAGPHAAALAPSLFAKVMLHCVPPRGGGEEVTLGAAGLEGVRVKSEDLTYVQDTGSHRTEVLIQMSDLEACHLDVSGGEVRIPGRSLRDFALATETFGRDMESLGISGSPLLELRFGEASASVLCSLAMASDGEARPIDGFQAVLMLGIREALAPVPTPVVPTPAPSQRKTQQRGVKRRAVEDLDFDAFPEGAQNGMPSMVPPQSQSVRPPPTQAVSTQSALSQRLLQLKAPSQTQPNGSMPARAVPNGANMPAVQPVAVAPTLQMPSSPPPRPRVNGAGGVVAQSPTLASQLLGQAFDSDDELIGADRDEIAYARGDQEEEAPDWFDCERLW